jgi:hypothetical protein
MDKSKDQDRGKGAIEQDQQNQTSNTNMQGQLGHRNEDVELKNADAICPGETCRVSPPLRELQGRGFVTTLGPETTKVNTLNFLF